MGGSVLPAQRIVAAKVGETERLFGLVACTPGANEATWGAWTLVSAATAADGYITEVAFVGTDTLTRGTGFAVQIGTGAAAAEVPVVSLALDAGSSGGGSGLVGHYNGPVPIPVFVPAGTRLTARCRWLANSGTAYVFFRMVDAANLITI